jgi:hypothetical protein
MNDKNRSDLEKFVNLYKEFGINLKPFVQPHETRIILATGDTHHYPGETGSHSPLFGGYDGFHSVVVFDENGKFKYQNFYE